MTSTHIIAFVFALIVVGLAWLFAPWSLWLALFFFMFVSFYRWLIVTPSDPYGRW
jgi:hypothetical protein